MTLSSARPRRLEHHPTPVAYPAEQRRILDRYDTASAGKEKNAAMCDLLTHAQEHGDLIDQIAAHAPRSSTDTLHSRR